MSQINPFIGSILQGSDVQRQQATEKDRRLRKAADLQKNSALPGDRFEHAVESAEEIAEVHDEQKNDPKKRRERGTQKKAEMDSDEPDSGLDLTA